VDLQSSRNSLVTNEKQLAANEGDELF